MNECLIVKEELILKAQNWTNEKKINKISYDRQITFGKLIDNQNLLKAKIIEAITFGGIKARKALTKEIKPLVILIYQKWSINSCKCEHKQDI